MAWVAEAPAGRRQRARRPTSPRAYGLLRPVGAAGPRHPAAADAPRPVQRGVPLHDARGSSRRHRALPGACGSPTWASWAGSCTAPASTAWRCGTRCGRPAPGTACVACGYRAIDALRIEKGYRVWGSDITPDETPDEAGLGFAVKPDKGDFIGRDGAAGQARAPGRAAAVPAWCSPTRVRSASAPSRCGWAARWPAASPPAATATRSSGRSPTPAAAGGGRGRHRRRGRGVRRVGGGRGGSRAAVGPDRRAYPHLNQPRR